VIIYVNGDGHCAAAYAEVPHAVAEEDFDFWYQGRVPHPTNYATSWPYLLADVFKAEIKVDADIRNTETDILYHTKTYVDKNWQRGALKVILGFPFENLERFQQLSNYLKDREVRHIFYPTSDYVKYLIKHGHRPNLKGFFNGQAHRIWATYISEHLTKLV